MCGSSRAGRLPKCGAPRSRCRAQSSGARPRWRASKWWKEERHGVFLDYNQNAKDRTTCSAYSVRPLPDARVSTPLDWHEVPDCDPADFTVLTVPKRFAELGDPHARMDEAAGSLEKLLELADEDEAAGLGDAPWPPHFRKMEGEGTARRAFARQVCCQASRATKMPLVVIANSPDKEAALAGLETVEEQASRGGRTPRRRRRAGRFDARKILDLDAHPREPAECA